MKHDSTGFGPLSALRGGRNFIRHEMIKMHVSIKFPLEAQRVYYSAYHPPYSKDDQVSVFEAMSSSLPFCSEGVGGGAGNPRRQLAQPLFR